MDDQAFPLCGTPEFSVVVPSFRRQHLLDALVRRCFAQVDIAPGLIEVVVVDNSPEGSAAPVIAALASEFAESLIHVHETRPGISAARNAGIAIARGRWIAFVDDDELPAFDWLAALRRCRDSHAADIVFGPVLPVLEDCDPDKARTLESAFTQDSDCPSGTTVAPQTVFSAMRGSALCFRPMATNNVLIDRQSCITSREPFATHLGAIGGEDTLFFLGLHYDGRKMVWCREARVTETIPVERQTNAYLMRKRFRSGQITSFTALMVTPPRPFRLVESIVVGFSQVVVGSALYLMLAAVGSGNMRRAGGTVAGGLGKLLWMPPFRRRSYGASSRAAAAS